MAMEVDKNVCTIPPMDTTVSISVTPTDVTHFSAEMQGREIPISVSDYTHELQCSGDNTNYLPPPKYIHLVHQQ